MSWEGEDASRVAALVAENERLRKALAKADAEVVVLADSLRVAGVAPVLVQAIIDGARPRSTA